MSCKVSYWYRYQEHMANQQMNNKNESSNIGSPKSFTL